MRRLAFAILHILALPFAVLLFVWEYYTKNTYIDATIYQRKDENE